MTSTDHRQVLGNCPLFHGMSPEQRQRWLDEMEHIVLEGGETLLEEGAQTQELFVILRGACDVVKAGPDGVSRKLATLEPPAVVGEMSFIDGAPHSATVKTVGKVELLKLTREQFDQLTETNASAANRLVLNLVSVVAERLRKMDEWVFSLLKHPEHASRQQEWQEFRARLFSDWQVDAS